MSDQTRDSEDVLIEWVQHSLTPSLLRACSLLLAREGKGGLDSFMVMGALGIGFLMGAEHAMEFGPAFLPSMGRMQGDAVDGLRAALSAEGLQS